MTSFAPANSSKRIIAYSSSEWAYTIVITESLVELRGEVARSSSKNSTVVVFHDSFLSKSAYFNDVMRHIRTAVADGCRLLCKSIESGKHTKSLASIEDIVEWMVDENIPRDSLLIAVGGGVVGDLVGFLSSVYFRGVDLFHIPTNLLAMCDSCIGGKTAVNTSRHINTLGTYKQPKGTVMLTKFLDTLSDREFCAGLAEIIKISLLPGGENLNSLLRTHQGGAESLRGDISLLSSIIESAVRLKILYTEHDIQESGKRLYLNLGHTFGHAIESLQDLMTEEYYRHGEAVSLGLLCSTSLSDNLYGTSYTDSVKELLEKYSLPTRLDESYLNKLAFSRDDRLLDALISSSIKDKKGRDGMLRLVIIDKHKKASLYVTNNEDLLRLAFRYVVDAH